jgi:hypothetical protein
VALQIPKQHVAAILKIRQLSDASAEKLIDALASSPFTSEADEMAKRIAKRVPDIQPKDLKAIVDTVYALHYVREFSEVKASKFLGDLVQAVKATGESRLALEPAEAERLRDRFKRLLDIENIRLLSKALKLQRDGERLYCDAKILSDIRPVFHDDVSSKPAGAVVSHTLKLGYHEGRQHKDFFVVLESADLDALKELVERAHVKAKTLRALLTDAGLEDLGL